MILGSVQNPHKLPAGELIRADGVYDLSMGRYHDQCCAGPSISSSGLRTIWSQSPKHYWKDSALNADRKVPDEDEADRPYFSLGRAAHHLLFLGRKGFDREFVVRPEKWSNWSTDASKDWRRLNRRAGLTAITPEEMAQIAGMAKSLGEHPMVKAGILDGAVERSMIFQDRETGIWLKSRPDNITVSDTDFSDLKTTATGVSDVAIERTLKSYQYQMQGGLVGLAAERCLQVQMTSFTLVFVETKEPHCVAVTTIPDEDIYRGREQILATTRIFAECLRTGDWPGPGGNSEDAKMVGLDKWERERIDARLALLKQTTPDHPHPLAAE